MYISTKTYGHERGLSCCFRQWRADSHCKLLHGYALRIKLEFGTETLDHRNWVVDFGGLKTVENWLKNQFDHTTIVASDDPDMDLFRTLSVNGLIDLRVVRNVGCECFAEMIHDAVSLWLEETGPDEVKLLSVEVNEHGANGAIYRPEGNN